MSSARPPSRAALGASLVALAASLAACDGSVPSSTASGSASPAAARCPADQVENSGIDGRVVDTDGEALPDVLILIETGTGFRGNTRTAEDGVFTAAGVTGDFTISTVDIDHVPLTQRVTVPCGETIEVELVLTPVEE
jgi:hypothetical protein